MNAVVALLTVGMAVHKPGFPDLLGEVVATHKVVTSKCHCEDCAAPRFFDVEWDNNTTGNGYMRDDLVPFIVVAESAAVAS